MSGVAILDDFTAGSIASLAAFRDQMVADRGHIENELEPPFDVILDLLERIIAELARGALEARS